MGKNVQEEKLKIPASLTELDAILDTTEQMMEPTGASMRTVKAVQLSIEEIFVNICSYAYPEDYAGEKDCEIIWQLSQQEGSAKMSVWLKDRGTPFDPLDREDPDTTLAIKDRGEGGMGLFMVKQYMDRVSYEYKDSQNVVFIEKEWPLDI